MKSIAWIVLVAILLIWTFGFSFCIVFLTAVMIFFVGGVTYIYIHEEEYAETYYNKLMNYSFHNDYMKMVSELMKKRKKKHNFDNRLTGSHVIDEELQTILFYVFRDFVYLWYDKISDDQEFPCELEETAHKVIIAIANRIKEVDWIPYLTTQLVDDVASHLRLYKQSRSKMKSCKSSNHNNLEAYFFDLEFTMEHSEICRDHICLNAKEEKDYLQLIADALLFQVIHESDFLCKPLRFLAREILCEVILLPLISMVSDPDYINQTIIWLCSDFPVTSEIFLTVLKTTNNVDELYATRSCIQKEIAALRCKDANCDSDPSMKNQLSSLLFVDKIIDVRLNRLQEGSDRDSTGLPSVVNYSNLLAQQKLIQLPLDLILKNNVALSYFIDYMSSINSQVYIFAYLNMEGWRTSARQELAKFNQQKEKKEGGNEAVYEQLKSAAQLLYDQYLTDKTPTKLITDMTVIRTVYMRIYSELPSEDWFDDVIQNLFVKLLNEPKFLPGFRTSPSYVKLLVELELLKEPLLKENDNDEGVSADEFMGSSSGSSVTNSPVRSINKDFEDSEQSSNEDLSCQASAFTLSAKIIETGLVQENGKTFGVYAIAVTKLFGNGQSESWHVYRRYSDFYDLHQKLKERYADISQVPFPGKKAFNNMERNVREKRMKMLNNYMRILFQLSVIKSHPILQDELLAFLESEYDKGGPGGQLAKTFDNLVINPLKVVGNAVKTMPDNLLNTMDGMMEGFSKVFTKSFRPDDEEGTTKVSSEIDVESHNIPLRIMLLFMTEVFDLKTRNQWLRKRIITLVRQIMHAMFGDIVNRRILDYVAVITSPSRVAQCLANLKNSIWPNSVRAQSSPTRDSDIRMQTRVAAKCALMASFSDDLKHILGSETSRTGMMLLFSMFQHQVLNKRLMFVILEGFLVALFPNLNNLFVKLHAQSTRVLYNKNKKRTKK